MRDTKRNPSLDRNTVRLSAVARRQADIKVAAMAVMMAGIVLAGCAATQMAEEFTPGADALFREFLTCHFRTLRNEIAGTPPEMREMLV